MIGAPDAGETWFAIGGFGFDVERIVLNNLLRLLGRDFMVGNVIAIGIVPLKGKTGIQSPL